MKLLFLICPLFFSICFAQSFQIEDQIVVGANFYDVPIAAIYESNSIIYAGNSTSGNNGDKNSANYGSTDFWLLSLDNNNQIEWQASFGGGSDDQVEKLISTNDGGILIGGSSNSGINGNKTAPNKGLYDYWIIKTDASGNEMWQNSYGGTGSDRLVDMYELSDGSILLLGSSDSPISGDKTEASLGALDYWLIKIDDSGNILWDRTIGGSMNDGASSIEISSTGEIYVSGVSESPVSGDKSDPSFNGSSDVWLVKLDDSGSTLWDITMGGDQNETSSDLFLFNNQIYTFGNSLSGISGTKTEASRGSFDIWLNKLDLQGNILMDKTVGGSGLDQLINATITSSGEFLISSQSDSDVSGEVEINSNNNSLDFWILVLDSNDLSINNQFKYGGHQSEVLPNIIEGTNNSLIIFGGSDSNISGDKTEPSKGGTDFWILELSTDLSINQTENIQSFLVYPNPSLDKVNFKGILEFAENCVVSVINQQGQVVKIKKLKSIDDGLNISSLKNGSYILKIKSKNRLYHSNLIVK